jgi:hypothetical protein
MFGLTKKTPKSDELTVQVHVAGSHEAWQLAQKIWNENQRNLRSDSSTGKDFLHFAYANPKCVVWLQRDRNHQTFMELVVRWEHDGLHEVFVLYNTGEPEGDDTRAKQLLNSVLSTPSIVPSGGQ